jgi:PncC family amidohydrolase
MVPPDTALAALAADLQRTCLAAGLTVATAESCTGGLVAHAITANAGSSGYFVGGVVSYSNEAKHELIGVPNELIAEHGAVSPEVATAMAVGVRDRLGADLGVAVTGIAGPDGGTAEKPVGLVYIGLADRAGRLESRRYLWDGDRATNIAASAAAALAWTDEWAAARADAS